MSENKLSGQHKLSPLFVGLATVFCVCLVASNIFVPRLWQVGQLPIQLSGAVIIFPISYIIGDLLTEVYGYRRAMLVIWLGFAMSAFIAIVGHLITLLPAPLSQENQAMADSFNSLFHMVPRVTFSSLLAFILGSHINASVMSRMKVVQKGNGFGWRAIISTIAGEMSDSLIFYPLAFGGILPFPAILGLIATQVSVKTLYEIIILPLTTYLARVLKKKEGVDTFDYDISYNPFKLKV